MIAHEFIAGHVKNQLILTNSNWKPPTCLLSILNSLIKEQKTHILHFDFGIWLTTYFQSLPLPKILTLSLFLFQAVLDGYGWLLKDQTSRLPHVNKFLKKVPDYQVLKQN